MKILAFDISSVSTGYSVLNNGRLLKNHFGLIEMKSKTPHHERLVTFEKEISRLIDQHSPDCTIIEEVFKGRNIKTFKILCMFRGVALKTIYDKTGQPPIILSASETRSLLQINNSKEATFDFITKKYKLNNFNLEEHNDITDSIALALAAYTIRKKGIDERSLRNSRSRKKRRRRKNKKGVSLTSTKVSSRSKSK